MKKNQNNLLTFHNYKVEKQVNLLIIFFLDSDLNSSEIKIVHFDENNMLSDHYPIQVNIN